MKKNLIHFTEAELHVLLGMCRQVDPFDVDFVPVSKIEGKV